MPYNPGLGYMYYWVVGSIGVADVLERPIVPFLFTSFLQKNIALTSTFFHIFWRLFIFPWGSKLHSWVLHCICAHERFEVHLVISILAHPYFIQRLGLF